jgi:hypothetical protein
MRICWHSLSYRATLHMRFLRSTTRLCSLLHNVLPTLPISTTSLLELTCFYAYTFTAIHCLEANHMLVQKKMSIYYYACSEENEHTIMLSTWRRVELLFDRWCSCWNKADPKAVTFEQVRRACLPDGKIPDDKCNCEWWQCWQMQPEPCS